MKINKIFLMAGLAMMSFFVSSCSDDDDDYAPGPQVAANCPDVRFGAENAAFVEIDPSSPSFDVVVKRTATDAATYTINVDKNEQNAFSIPQSVSFAAGETETTITIGVSASAPTATDLAMAISFDDEVKNYYKEGEVGAYGVVINIVKWNTIGTGTWYDGFWYGFVDEVEIQQRDDDPTQYRCTNPYTEDKVLADGSIVGTYNKFLTVFTLKKDGHITWDKFFFINTISANYGAEIKAYMPSEKGGSNADSVAEFDEDGNILYFQIDPYWYMDGVGGWGNGYPCYLAWPGVEL